MRSSLTVDNVRAGFFGNGMTDDKSHTVPYLFKFMGTLT